jgi:Bacterial regulatory proteins, luxR family
MSIPPLGPPLEDFLSLPSEPAKAPSALPESIAIDSTPEKSGANWLNGTPVAASAGSGFLLVDAAMNPISFNAEAMQILSYPDTMGASKTPEEFLAGKIRSLLANRQASNGMPFVTEFRSGRRRFFCRAFAVDGSSESGQRIAILLERGPSGLVPLAKVSLQGLSSKEIANRMAISPNTVKTFLRLIMIKTGASSRSAVVRKVMMMAS